MARLIRRHLLSAWGMGMVLLGNVAAQESTPSQKTSDAIQKFTQTPKAISRSLEALTEAAKKTLQQAVGEKPATSSKATSDDLTTPPKQSERPAAARFSPEGRRDPFQPMTLRTKNSSRPRGSSRSSRTKKNAAKAPGWKCGRNCWTERTSPTP